MIHCEILLVEDGQSVRKYLQNNVPDLIFLDLHLPKNSGETLVSEIRSTKQLDKSRLIILSADALQIKRLEKRADATLLKPVRLANLLIICEEVALVR